MNNKKFLGTLLVSSSLVLLPFTVNAESGTVKVNAERNIYNGETEEVTLNVSSDLEEGLAAAGGDLVYDSSYLELVNVKNTDSKYYFSGSKRNDNTYRIAFIDLSGKNGMKGENTVYTFTFKALKEGTTNVSFENCELVNTNAEDIACSTESVSINITNKPVQEINVKTEEVKENNTKNEAKEEVPAKKVALNETKEDNSETKEEENKEETVEEDSTNKEDRKETKKENKESKKASSEKNETIMDKIKKFFENIFKLFK